jgi:hypothetical protein
VLIAGIASARGHVLGGDPVGRHETAKEFEILRAPLVVLPQAQYGSGSLAGSIAILPGIAVQTAWLIVWAMGCCRQLLSAPPTKALLRDGDYAAGRSAVQPNLVYRDDRRLPSMI